MIISLILIGLCLVIILAIVLKKFPALAILDVSSMADAKEAKFKEQLIKARVERDVAKLSGRLGRIWLWLSRSLARFLDSSQKALKKIKLSYRAGEKIPWPEKNKRIKELFVASEEALKKEAYNEAEEKLVEIISLDQKNLLAFCRLAALYDQLKKLPEARQTYEYALKLARVRQGDRPVAEGLSLAEIYFSLAGVEKAADDLGAARENLREALDLEPNNPRYLDLILDLSIMEKDKVAAQEYFKKLAAVNPENNKLAAWQEEIARLED